MQINCMADNQPGQCSGQGKLPLCAHLQAQAMGFQMAATRVIHSMHKAS